jgi:hypothetical protein
MTNELYFLGNFRFAGCRFLPAKWRCSRCLVWRSGLPSVSIAYFKYNFYHKPVQSGVGGCGDNKNKMLILNYVFSNSSALGIKFAGQYSPRRIKFLAAAVNGEDLAIRDIEMMILPDSKWDVPGLAHNPNGNYTVPVGQNYDPLHVGRGCVQDF